VAGAAPRTATPDANGYYEFTGLKTGQYTITETKPAACYDGGQHTISVASLGALQQLTGRDFRELGLRPEYIPNRLLAVSAQPVGSAAWSEALSYAMAGADPSIRIGSFGSAVVSSPVAAVPVARRAAHVTTADLKLIVDEAIRRWAAAGLPAQAVAKLAQTKVVVTDLPGTELGWTNKDGVYIDDNAAGNGWFVDPTPGADEEFASSSLAGQSRATAPAAVNHMDLLTVVEHELGHVLGLDDLGATTHDLMGGSLADGLRLAPGPADIDAVLASGQWNG
jgi:hypothetical protein